MSISKVLIAVAMASTGFQSSKPAIGDKVGGEVTLISGAKAELSALGSKASVLLFVTTDCPIANRFAKEYRRIYDDFRGRGIGFILVYVDPSSNIEAIKKHRREYSLGNFVACFDEQHQVVKAVGAGVTPEAVVIAPDGTMKYRGRINSQYEEHGRPKGSKVRQDLREAILEVMAGKSVSMPEIPAVGCPIPE